MASVSKLDYVMKELGVSGIEAAALLGVDATTVSKWRNSQRKIPHKDGIALKLAAFLIRKEEEQKGQTISNILRTLKNGDALESAGRQADLFSRWLTEKEPQPGTEKNDRRAVFTPQNGYNTEISLFFGEDGVDEAIKCFWEYALRLAPGKTVYFVDNAGIHWTNGSTGAEKKTRIGNCMRYFRAASQYGHRLAAVDCDIDLYRPYRAIFRWLELYLLKGVESWSFLPLQGEACHSCTFLIANEALLQCIPGSDIDQKPHGILYTNKETVEFFANSVYEVLKRSKPLIHLLPAGEVSPLIETARQNLKENRHIYMLNPSLTLQFIDVQLLGEILAANCVPEAKAGECMAAAKRIRRLQASYCCTYLCALPVLEDFLSEEYMVDAGLSELCRTKILLSKEFRRKIIDSFMDSAVYQNSPVIFTPGEHLGQIPSRLSLLAGEDSFLAIWDIRKYKEILYCLNLDVISGFYRYIDDLTAGIPKVCHSREWRSKQLNRIREALS